MPILKQMPRYKCHKEVGAFKIAVLEYRSDGGLKITPAESGFDVVYVEPEFVPRHDPARPQVGWYLVVYENGYKSFSPAKAFEEGYPPIQGMGQTAT